MRATENAGFNAKVHRNLGLDFVTKQHNNDNNNNNDRLTAFDPGQPG